MYNHKNVILILIMYVYIAGNLNSTVGNDSGLAEDEIASGFLPLSLFESEDMSIPIVLVVFRTGILFSIEGNQSDIEGLETSVGSPVVSLTAGVNQTFRNLPDPVIVNVRILVEVSKMASLNRNQLSKFVPVCNIKELEFQLLSLYSLRTLQTHDVYLMTLINKVCIWTNKSHCTANMNAVYNAILRMFLGTYVYA